MKRSDFLLFVLDAFDGSMGRTLLQKRCFFITLLLDLEELCEFRAHYYGPYSPLIDQTLAELVSLGLVEEQRIGFGAVRQGFEIRRHDYKLTPDGKEVVALLREEHPKQHSRVTDAAKRIVAAGNPGYLELSIAAKALYIIRAEERPMASQEIMSEARSFGWDIDPQSLCQSVEFLEKLNLARRG